MPQIKISVGEVFSDLTVLAQSETRLRNVVTWTCRCICGKECLVTSADLSSGNTKSCGCRILRVMAVLHKTHGKSYVPEYQIWSRMIQRCTNPKAAAFPWYGGRGIKVCPEWEKSFEQFHKDIGPRPSDKHSLERVDNDGDYKPGNVKWATKLEQGCNKRNNHNVTFNGETFHISEWARRLGIDRTILKDRLRRGWSDAEAISIPVGERRKLK